MRKRSELFSSIFSHFFLCIDVVVVVVDVLKRKIGNFGVMIIIIIIVMKF